MYILYDDILIYSLNAYTNVRSVLSPAGRSMAFSFFGIGRDGMGWDGMGV